MKFRTHWLMAMALGLLVGLAQAELPVPPPGKRVTDLVGVLSAAESEALSVKSEALEKKSGAQVAVLIVGTLDGEPIESYAQRVFDAWKPGRAGVNDGVLLVLAKQDRKIRVHVGRGLEGAIPDLQAKRITSGSMGPAFKQEQFAAGFSAALDAIGPLVVKEALAPVATSSVAQTGPNPEYVFGVGILLAGLAFFIVRTLVSGPKAAYAAAPRPTPEPRPDNSPVFRTAPSPRSRSVYAPSPAPSPARRSNRSEATSSYFPTSSPSPYPSPSPSPSPSPAPSVSYGGGDSAGGGASDSY